MVFFDLELTGDDPARDEVIEIAAERVLDGRVIDRLTSLVRATFPSSDGAQAVHRIDPRALETAPAFEAVAPAIAAIFRGAVPVAHGTELDLAVLARTLPPLGLEPPRFAVDTTLLARRALALKASKLRSVHAALGLDAGADYAWHRAEPDMRATRAVFEALAPRFAPTSGRDLWEVRAGQTESVRVRGSVSARLEELARSQARCALVVRARARDELTVRGVVEHWSPPHALLRETKHRVHLVRADRVLRVVEEPDRPRGR